MTRAQARLFRAQLDSVIDTLDDAAALDVQTLFPEWRIGKDYVTGERVRYHGELYKCAQAHTSQADWTPDQTPALWVRVADPTIEWPPWEQKQGAHDAYRLGAKVSHNEKHWISEIDYNTYEPGVYGWAEQQ